MTTAVLPASYSSEDVPTETRVVYYTEWSKRLCGTDDYNTLGYLAQSDSLAADRQGQGNTGLTLPPSVIPNSNTLSW
jgi:hypothetical protein